MQSPALQSVAESCCGLNPGCHALRCDPSVSVTLPALRQGKGNRREGGRALLLSFRNERQARCWLRLVRAPLVFCHLVECEPQNLIIGNKWTSTETSAVLCCNNKKSYILKGYTRSTNSTPESAFRKQLLALSSHSRWEAFVFIVILSLGMAMRWLIISCCSLTLAEGWQRSSEHDGLGGGRRYYGPGNWWSTITHKQFN